MSTALSSSSIILSDGTNIYSNTTFSFETGTKTLFVQTAAPTGWIKDVSNNDAMLRVTSGSTGGNTGGSRNFSSALVSKTISGGSSSSHNLGLNSSSVTISTSQFVSHNHSFNAAGGTSTSNAGSGNPAAYIGGTGSTLSTVGGRVAHSHSASWSHNHSWTYSGDSLNFSVKYVDIITAIKS